MAKYAFAFPFGNYSPMSLLKVHGPSVELLQPIRSQDPSILGHIVIIDHGKVQRGAWNVFNMLRESVGFEGRGTTLVVSCVSRRLAEMIAGCTSNTEGQIFKEKLSSLKSWGSWHTASCRSPRDGKDPRHLSQAAWVSFT